MQNLNLMDYVAQKNFILDLIFQFSKLQDLSVSLPIMSWTGSVSGAVCYILVLWLLPDLRDSCTGDMETHWRRNTSRQLSLLYFLTGD